MRQFQKKKFKKLTLIYQLDDKFNTLKIDVKILLLNFKALHGLSLCYICDLLVPHESAGNLRSFERGLLSVPGVRLTATSVRTFILRAPKLLNELPVEIGLA